MHHEPHVRPVDPHAEGDRGHHDDRFARPEAGQRHALLHRRQPGVKRDRSDAARFQAVRHPLGLCPAVAINDTRLPGMPLQEGGELRRFPSLGLRRDMQVAPVERRREHRRAGHVQRIEDVGAGARVGRRGQRDARHAGKVLPQPLEHAVFRPELVSPGGHAMRLVHCDQRHFLTPQPFPRARHHQAFRRDVEQVERAVRQGVRHAGCFVRLNLRVQRPSVHPELA